MSALQQTRRFALRARTAAAHEALDAAVGEWRNGGDYRAYLHGLAGFRLPAEATLSTVTWPVSFRDWRPRLIADALRRDASVLKVDLPAAPASNRMHGSSALLGLLYVLEGSSLGAQLLVRRAAALGFSPSRGAAHLEMLAADLENWRRFLAVLETDEAFDLDAAADAANETFRRACATFSLDAEP